MFRLCSLALALAASGGLLAQTPAPTADPQRVPLVSVDATAVLVDVVVRDRRGRPVTDLAAEDFEVYEDGVRQQVTSFRLVAADRPEAGRMATAGAAAAGAAPETPDVSVTALVFDRLSAEARTLARQAALGFVQQDRSPGDRTGVFAIDLSLQTLQPYTSEPSALRQAIDRVTGQAAGAQEAPVEQGPAASGSGDGAGPAAPTGGAGPAQGAQMAAAGQQAGMGAADQLMQDMVDRMDQAYDGLSRDQSGYATTNALLAVVHSLALMPGRKTAVFFSEGVAIPPAVVHHFQSVVDTANRSNVSIYVLDAAGLRIHSELAQTRSQLQTEMQELERSRRSGIMMKGLEANEGLLRGSSESGLAALAQQTGGLFVGNTNDLRPGIRRIDEDRRFHYLLGYTPTNDALDGRYRQIAVRVNRPGTELRARPGYHAIRSPGPVPVLSYEAPALALLDGPALPNAFPVRTAAVSFPDPGRPGLTPVLVGLGTDALSFQEDRGERRYTADFTVLVRLRDAEGDVVHKLSQRYELAGPLDQIPQARQGEVIFYRQPELAPGLYTLEAIVYDAIANEASARVATVEVPPTLSRGPHVSTLMLIQHTEQVPAGERDPENPLYYGDLLLYPHLGDPFSKAEDRELSFFLAIHAGERLAKPRATLELRHGGQALAQLPVELPDSSGAGRIEYTGRLPLEPLPAGTYELAVTVTSGAREIIRTAGFRVVP